MATPRACPASEAPPAAPGRIRGGCAPPWGAGTEREQHRQHRARPRRERVQESVAAARGGTRGAPPVGLQGVLSELGAAAAALAGVEAGK